MMRCFTHMKGKPLLLLFVFLIVIVGCGGPPPVTPPAPTLPPPSPSPEQPLPPPPDQEEKETISAKTVSVQVAATRIAFDKSIVTVPADAIVTLVFTNDEDPIIFHNVAIYKSKAATEPIMVGEFIPGGAEIIYQFVAPSTPGTYFFRCDVHPLIMVGEFIVQ